VASFTLRPLADYQKNLLHHIHRMKTNRTQKQGLGYKAFGSRDPGHQREEWRDRLLPEVAVSMEVGISVREFVLRTRNPSF
jgi:hypothetical protein